MSTTAMAFGLRRRTALLLAAASLLCLVAFTWPLVADSRGAGLVHGNSNLAHSADAPWVFVALLPLLLAIVLAELADGTLDAKSVAVLGVLAACGCALRLPGGVSGFEPVFFLLIPAGRVLGRGFGFVLGALTLFASALITGGVGPWLPFQMFGAAWVGFFAGCLPPARGRRELALLAGYGFVAGLVYGLLLWPYLSAGTQLGPIPGASVGENLHRFVTYHLATAMGWDLVRALTNAVLVLVAGAPVLAALRRAARRAAFGAPVTFEASAVDASLGSETPPTPRERSHG
jgi:energy-coupling factor transport system substrate-specific component